MGLCGFYDLVLASSSTNTCSYNLLCMTEIHECPECAINLRILVLFLASGRWKSLCFALFYRTMSCSFEGCESCGWEFLSARELIFLMEQHLDTTTTSE